MSDDTREGRGLPLRGFAALTLEHRKSISSMGGKAAHAAGTAHQFTSDEAKEAGRKGGHAAHAKRVQERSPIADTDSTFTEE